MVASHSSSFGEMALQHCSSLKDLTSTLHTKAKMRGQYVDHTMSPEGDPYLDASNFCCERTNIAAMLAMLVEQRMFPSNATILT